MHIGHYEYRLIATGWFLLLAILTVFWYAVLRRLEVVMKERLSATRSRHTISGLPSMFAFLFRGEFKETGDERLASMCRRLRQLLYGYLGTIGAYVVFLVIFYSRY